MCTRCFGCLLLFLAHQSASDGTGMLRKRLCICPCISVDFMYLLVYVQGVQGWQSPSTLFEESLFEAPKNAALAHAQDAYDILEDEGIPLRAGSPHMGTEALTPAQLSEQQVLEQEEGGEEVEEEEDEEEGEEEEGDDFGIEESDEYAYLF
eukprot:1159741-Pelagomonas_calceolata.AAC.2